MPDVSVIAFLRNNASCLARTIESLQQQSLSDWEIVIVNDRSTDLSQSLIQGYQQQDPRIRTFHNKCQRGFACSMNVGLEKITGRSIAFCTPGDTFLKGHLESLLAFARRSKNPIPVVISEGQYVDSDEPVLGSVFFKSYCGVWGKRCL